MPFSRQPRAMGVAALVILLATTAIVAALVTRKDFLAAINSERVNKGCHVLVSASDSLIDDARQHSREMSNADQIFHSTLYIGTWSAIGEIVGHGSDLDSLFDAFMKSPEHREIMLDCAYDIAAIGIYRDDGIWLTGRFYSK